MHTTLFVSLHPTSTETLTVWHKGTVNLGSTCRVILYSGSSKWNLSTSQISGGGIWRTGPRTTSENSDAQAEQDDV